MGVDTMGDTLIKKCPSCRSTTVTQNDKGEWACHKCPYVWKPITTIKSTQEVQNGINNI